MPLRRVAGEPLDVPEWTLPAVLARTARAHPSRPAFLSPARDGTVATTTWGEAHARATRIANGLLSMGLRPGERVAIVSETRAEWALADAAILLAGGVTVAIFPTLPAAQTQRLLRDSRSRFAFVEDEAQWAKLRDADTPVERSIAFDRAAATDKTLDALATLEVEGERFAAREPGALAARAATVKADDVATIVYTSGTTGHHKGVLLTHRNFVASALASIRALALREHPVGLAFLPLAHSYQRQNAVVLILLAGTVAFSSPARLADDLRVVRPTLLPAVPRLYERMQERIRAKVATMLPHRRAIFRAAERAAIERGRAGRPPHPLFERLVYRRLRRMAGLDRLELGITGAAAMRPELLWFFHGIGVRIVEGWGLSETTAPATVNRPAGARAGTVGPALPGVEVALAEDDEVLVRGPIVFAGYDGLPDDTAAAFHDEDGARWFRTGDLGAFDDEGRLRIVDRKKDLEVLDTGKKVVPTPIEEALKASPFVAEALVVATGRKVVGALLQPDLDAVVAHARARGVAVDERALVRGHGPSGEPCLVAVPPALLEHAEVRAALQGAVDAANRDLAPHEQVRVWRATAPFRVEDGTLTPTLKKRRAAILGRDAALVDAMFR